MWEAGSGIAANRLNDLKGVLGSLGTCLAWRDKLSQSMILISLAPCFPHLLGPEVDKYFPESQCDLSCGSEAHSFWRLCPKLLGPEGAGEQEGR